MTDEELVRAFESTELPAAEFSHRAHVRVAWWYLRHAPLPDALARFITALKRFAIANAVPGLYHETITVAWMLLLAERLDGGSRDLAWHEFEAQHPELFAQPSILSRYYTDETLQSERARRVFVMPDRVAPPAHALELEAPLR